MLRESCLRSFHVYRGSQEAEWLRMTLMKATHEFPQGGPRKNTRSCWTRTGQIDSNCPLFPMKHDETWWNMTVRYAHLRSPQIWSDRAIERCNLLVRWRFFIYDNKPSLWNDHPTICSNLIMRLNNNYNTYKYTWSYYIICIYIITYVNVCVCMCI
jgi:hypothetical protein